MNDRLPTDDGAQLPSPESAKSATQNVSKLSHRAENHLNFQFALLSAAGGLVLASGQGMQDIAVIAVLSAVFGFLFVDWLAIAHLPPMGAYLAMGAAAFYCVSDFWDMPQRSDQQMVSVAMLLVLVQAVLMLQKKSRRIFEQLGVFCLLELVVAAIFTDAINYGMLLIPTGLVGGWALSLLGITATIEDVPIAPRRSTGLRGTGPRSSALLGGQSKDESVDPEWQRSVDGERRSLLARWFLTPLGPNDPNTPTIQTWSPQSIESMARASRRWPRYAVMTLSPSILIVGFVFFYALPRRVDANRSPGGGKTLVGFDDQIRLEQLGYMMQNSDTALRIRLKNQDTGEPYRLAQGLYLRGRVLETYSVDWSTQVATWSAAEDEAERRSRVLPLEYVPKPGERNLYDSVTVEISCEPMSRPALFSVAPLHRNGVQREILYSADQWTLSRRESGGPFGRIDYRFGTNAFFRGVQSDWIEATGSGSGIFSEPFSRRGFRGLQSRRRRGEINNVGELTQFQSSRMPKIRQLALRLIDQIPDRQQRSYEIAKAFERHLSEDPRYSYTLNLNAVPLEGLDPTEQFISVDQRGHCQYFGSALAMMLRSVGIPARMVVGYRTDEYSDLGEYYIARQQHAHAWVEALVDQTELPNGLTINGQQKTGQYWLRLDPTPGGGGIPGRTNQQVDTVIDYAKNVWKEYVVEMDVQRQSESFGETALTSDGIANGDWLGRIKETIAGLADRRPGTDNEQVSNVLKDVWPILVGVLVLAVVLSGSRRRNWLAFFGGRGARVPVVDTTETSVDTYTLALKQLRQAGFVRRSDETPDEFLTRSQVEIAEESIIAPLEIITEHFYHCRYGGQSGQSDVGSVHTELEKLREAIKITQQADVRT